MLPEGDGGSTAPLIGDSADAPQAALCSRADLGVPPRLRAADENMRLLDSRFGVMSIVPGSSSGSASPGAGDGREPDAPPASVTDFAEGVRGAPLPPPPCDVGDETGSPPLLRLRDELDDEEEDDLRRLDRGVPLPANDPSLPPRRGGRF